MHSLALIIISLLLGACVSNNPYPKDWDSLTPPPNLYCGNLNGMYKDRGELTGNTVIKSLTLLLFGNHNDRASATRVEFTSISAGILKVAVWDDTEILFTKEFSKENGDLECLEDNFVIKKTSWDSSEVATARTTYTITLYQEDPFLVTKVEEFSAGLFFVVIPIAASGTYWYRFERTTP